MQSEHTHTHTQCTSQCFHFLTHSLDTPTERVTALRFSMHSVDGPSSTGVWSSFAANEPLIAPESHLPFWVSKQVSGIESYNICTTQSTWHSQSHTSKVTKSQSSSNANGNVQINSHTKHKINTQSTCHRINTSHKHANHPKTQHNTSPFYEDESIDNNVLTRQYSLFNVPTGELHGDLSQQQRLESLQQFRKGEVTICLTITMSFL